MDQPTALLTIEQVALQLQVSDLTVRRMIADGRLDAVYLNPAAKRLLRIPATEVARLSTPPQAGEPVELTA